jgi:hypothetical protein
MSLPRTRVNRRACGSPGSVLLGLRHLDYARLRTAADDRRRILRRVHLATQRGAAYPMRLRLDARGRVDEDRAFGRVHHLCGDAPEPHSSDRPEIPAAHGQ